MALVDQIIGAESGGNPNAQNPNSSAGGLGQFIDATWVSMLQKHRPDLVEGRSPQELIALKSDPQLSREMTAAYAADNAGILSRSGLPVTPGTTYLAHFAGPQGAVGILNADPATPVSSLLTRGAVKANPFLQDMTAADLTAWADRKVGGKAAAIPIASPNVALQSPSNASPVSSGDPAEATDNSSDDSDNRTQILANILAAIEPQQAQPAPMFLPPRPRLAFNFNRRR